jgi:hypothetical protein
VPDRDHTTFEAAIWCAAAVMIIAACGLAGTILFLQLRLLF